MDVDATIFDIDIADLDVGNLLWTHRRVIDEFAHYKELRRIRAQEVGQPLSRLAIDQRAPLLFLGQRLDVIKRIFLAVAVLLRPAEKDLQRLRCIVITTIRKTLVENIIHIAHGVYLQERAGHLPRTPSVLAPGKKQSRHTRIALQCSRTQSLGFLVGKKTLAEILNFGVQSPVFSFLQGSPAAAQLSVHLLADVPGGHHLFVSLLVLFDNLLQAHTLTLHCVSLRIEDVIFQKDPHGFRLPHHGGEKSLNFGSG